MSRIGLEGCMLTMINAQVVMLENWCREMNAHRSVLDLFRATYELALGEGNDRMDTFDVLRKLTDLPSLGTQQYMVGLKSDRLLAWSKTQGAVDVRASIIGTDITQDSMFDMLRAIRTFNGGMSEQYRAHGPLEVAIGVFGSNSRLVKLFTDQTHKSRSDRLKDLGLNPDEIHAVLQGRQMNQRMVTSGRRASSLYR